jgi:hypothetical protein
VTYPAYNDTSVAERGLQAQDFTDKIETLNDLAEMELGLSDIELKKLNFKKWTNQKD